MTAFGKALTAMFADGNMAVAALYREKGVGAGVTIRAARYSPTGTFGFAQSDIIANGEQIELRQADAPRFGEGDTLEIDGVLWCVTGDPERDPLGMSWVAPIERAIP